MDKVYWNRYQTIDISLNIRRNISWILLLKLESVMPVNISSVHYLKRQRNQTSVVCNWHELQVKQQFRSGLLWWCQAWHKIIHLYVLKRSLVPSWLPSLLDLFCILELTGTDWCFASSISGKCSLESFIEVTKLRIFTYSTLRVAALRIS